MCLIHAMVEGRFCLSVMRAFGFVSLTRLRGRANLMKFLMEYVWMDEHGGYEQKFHILGSYYHALSDRSFKGGMRKYLGGELDEDALPFLG